MGIFTRFRDIINSNINSMLDRAENPEKLIQHMIYEMEDTLVELKSTCAAAIAEQKTIGRRLDRLQSRERHWEMRAEIAVEKGRDDLAKQALKEKHRISRIVESLGLEAGEHSAIVDRYREDIILLEEKLVSAREKQRILVHRYVRAHHARRAQEEIRRSDSFESIMRFDEFEERLDRMDAEVDLVNGDRNHGLEEQFQDMITESRLEEELQALKASRQQRQPRPEAMA
ncbi:MAG: phage shock protein A [Desulfobacteraceae bacterium]|nr:phage shock protein A [Desulfobacteraceae bacterium]